MKLTTKNTLTPEEAKRRAELETVIVPGLKNCIEVGAALRAMSDERLYRSTHSSFKDYVEETYKVSVRRAYELVEAAEVVQSLPESVRNSAHLNAGQASELAKAPKAKRAEVLKRAMVHASAAGKPVTAKLISQAVAAVTQSKPQPDPEPEPEAQRNDKKMLEAFGGKLPAIPTDDPVKEALRRHQQETVHNFKLAVGLLIADLPKNIDTFDITEWLHGQANLLSNRRDQQRNVRAYTT
jgi:hypothetical protein